MFWISCYGGLGGFGGFCGVFREFSGVWGFQGGLKRQTFSGTFGRWEFFWIVE